MIRTMARPLSFLLIFSFLLLDLTAVSARAGMVPTETILSMTKQADARTKVAEFLDRQDVRQAMVDQGVDPAEAKARVNTLSDQEVARLSSAIDQLPAGGDGVGTVIGAVVLIFVILLITDLLGLTHVFPFVNRR